MTTGPRPKRETIGVDYPTRSDWELDRRRFLGVVGLGIAGMGLAVSAGDAKRAISGGRKITNKHLIDAAIEGLGHEDFRIRKKATKALIAIGKGEAGSPRSRDDQKKLVLDAVKPLLKSKDPEIAQRAKSIILALTPPKKIPPPPREIEVLDGEIIIEE